MADQKLDEIVKEYADLAKEDKNIDAATLMINALQQHDQNRVNPKWKRWAFVISLTIPPVGLIFAAYYFLRTENDARSAGVWCIVLTAISLIATIVFFKIILDGSGASIEQIQQIKPEQIYELTQ